MNLFEDGYEGTRWGVGGDLVSELGDADGLGDACDERGVKAPGDLGELCSFRRAPERLAESYHVLGPEHELDRWPDLHGLLQRSGIHHRRPDL